MIAQVIPVYLLALVAYERRFVPQNMVFRVLIGIMCYALVFAEWVAIKNIDDGVDGRWGATVMYITLGSIVWLGSTIAAQFFVAPRSDGER